MEGPHSAGVQRRPAARGSDLRVAGSPDVDDVGQGVLVIAQDVEVDVAQLPG